MILVCYECISWPYKLSTHNILSGLVDGKGIFWYQLHDSTKIFAFSSPSNPPFFFSFEKLTSFW
uniref:Uncharacterized protein n=1 Tax=Rhizophora mucronata TaxID=61149 RepID=A0A2P2R1X7_RHIMU